MIETALILTPKTSSRILFKGQVQTLSLGFFFFNPSQPAHCIQKTHQHSVEILNFENMTTDANVWGCIRHLPDGSQHIFPIRFMQEIFIPLEMLARMYP